MLYDKKIFNDINLLHNKDVNNIAKYILLHGILNSSKRTKNINSHYSPLLHGFMNTRKGKAKFKKFRILLDSGFSYTIVMKRLILKLKTKEDTVIQ